MTENGTSIRPWHVIVLLVGLIAGMLGNLYMEDKTIWAEVRALDSCKVEKTEMNRMEDRLLVEFRSLAVKVESLDHYMRNGSDGK